MELIGVYLAGCLLLAGAGVAKALHPDDTARAFATVKGGGRLLGLSRTRRLVRAGALIEGALGTTGLLVVGRPVAAAVAASYGAFAGYVVIVRRRDGPLATCGCFGTPDTPATGLHVVVDLALACAAASVAFGAGSPSTVASVLARQPWQGVPLAFAAVLGAWVLFLILSTFPRLLAARSLDAR